MLATAWLLVCAPPIAVRLMNDEASTDLLAAARAKLVALQRNLSKIQHVDRQRFMGNSAGRVTEHGNASQTDALFQLVRGALPNARQGEAGLTFCEIGFNVGHSAVTFLTAAMVAGAAVSHYVIFDMVAHRSVLNGLQLVKGSFPSTSFHLNRGKSSETLPAYTTTIGHKTCDLLHIDGDHLGQTPATDWQNVQPLARLDARTFIIFDDCGCKRAAKMIWCVEPTRVFESAVQAGRIKLESRGQLAWPAKGSCAGRMVPIVP